MCSKLRLASTAAHEVNDLDLVAVTDECIGPVTAADHIFVQFYRDPLFWQRKKLQESIKVDLSGNFAFLAVYLN